MARGLMTTLLCSIDTLSIWSMSVMSTIWAPNQLRHADQISWDFKLFKTTFDKFKCSLKRPTESTYWCWTIFKHQLTQYINTQNHLKLFLPLDNLTITCRIAIESIPSSRWVLCRGWRKFSKKNQIWGGYYTDGGKNLQKLSIIGWVGVF